MTVELFVNWDDIVDVDKTIAKLHACTAKRAIVMAQPALDKPSLGHRVRTFADACHDAGIAVSLCTGPTVIARERPLDHRDRLLLLASECAAAPMLDAEPTKIDGALAHWSEALIAPWLEHPAVQITSTRAELPRIGWHGRWLYLQLEGQTSTDTLSQALAIAERTTDRSRIVCVPGTFDDVKDGVVIDKRTLAEVERDLRRCTAQARLSGRLAEFVARTTDARECELLSRWARETWPG